MENIRSAVVIGGTSGIGRSIALQLAKTGARVTCFGRRLPETTDENIEYLRLNLLGGDLDALNAYTGVDALIYCAGLGRVARFDDLTDAEISVLFRTNAEYLARVLHLFQPRLNSDGDFYCAVLGSIAGLIPSPMMTAYGAAKAAVQSLCTSVNAELRAQNRANRVLLVAPGSIPGTRFGGGEDNPAATQALAAEIVARMCSRETCFIPDYEKTYKSVLARADADPEAFAAQSWEYKQASGRVSDKPRMTVGFLSGTFDLFHIGHLNLLRRAKQYCDYLIVGVHPPGSSHKNKPTYIPLEERMAIIASVKYVDKVVVTLDEDDEMYALYPYDYLFVGDDYKGTPRFNKYEEELTPLGVKIIYFPYTKGTSSTQLRAALDAGRKPETAPEGGNS